jgi:4-alpha-glucanotransferase/(1->4)-alpha-D-glucan 1-alpha-D-glucosylmutase
MEKHNGLDLLALEAGIQSGFHDRRGIFHQVSVETKTALLQAMDLLPPEADPESALANLQAQNRRGLLPEVLVRSSEDHTHTIPLMLDREDIGREIRYYLAADQGESLSGQIATDDLQERGQDLQHPYIFELKEKLPPGYHRLTVHTANREATLRLIITPSSCYLPEKLQKKHRLWGTALQLSSLCSAHNWGIGDFGDLENFIDLCADIGIDAIGLSPLHLLCRQDSASSCPSVPSSRYFVDPLLVDLTRISDYSAERFHDPGFTAQLLACRQSEEIGYQRAARLKYEGFRILYRDFRKYHLDTGSERANEFRMFKAAGGKRLFRHCVFLALQEHFAEKASGREGWQNWPREYHHPDSEEVLRFSRQKREIVNLHSYILWQSELQLASCGDHSLARHLGVGLCPEIALGADPHGAETWVQQSLYSLGASMGAPPDEDYPQGLDWGLVPPIPRRLIQSGFEPFISLLRSNMRYAGAVQIDHAMQMMRLFWIPAGADARDGAYVQYPLQDLLGIVALESSRNRCMVMARERTSGTQYFDQMLREKNIFPCAFFLGKENDGKHFPSDCPEQTAAMVSSPGLTTLTGYWEGLDLESRHQESVSVSPEEFNWVQNQRQAEKKLALTAIEDEDLLPPGTVVSADTIPEMTDALNRAVHRYLARTPALVIMTRLEDIFRLREGRSLFPTGRDEDCPRLRFSPSLDDMASSSTLADFATAIANERASGPIVHEHRGHQPVQAVIPRATYRIQLNRDFTFSQATEIVAYLADLGISHCYTSPCFAARSGSTHGYDVVDPNAFNEEIGGMDDFRRFSQVLKDNNMGQIMDIVPNHMGVMGSDNLWWLDVLENGPSSSYAQFFDIDWDPAKGELRHKLLIPVLGEPYGEALEQGSLVLSADTAHGAFSVFYHGHRFPLDPRTYPAILNRRLDILEIRMGPDNQFLIELLSLITAFGQLSPAAETDPKRIRVRRRDKEILKDRLAVLAEKCPDIRRHLQETADEYNNRTADASNLPAFHALLEEQTFRLAYWRVAADEINYRRFFDINDLAALCVEKEEVFTATHRLVFDLIRQGRIEGLRIDHPDGLFAPAEYYRRLCNELQPARTEELETPVYLVAEKILAHYEHLPPNWPIHGTTGYDFASLVNNLFVDRQSEKRLSRIYRRFTGVTDSFDTILYSCKKQIMRLVLASELNVLANRLDKLSERSWQTRDFTLNNLREALSEVAACFPVYRTYVTEKDISAQDRNSIDWAISQAKKNSPVSDHTIFDFLRTVLLPEAEAGMSHDFRLAAVDFAMRFQQFTAPVMAKGMEDTAFYIYNRLVSLNEVGSDPRRFGNSIAAFHRLCRERAERWPHSMLTTSTHDSKRSEDARCRLNVLSEIPDEWNKRLLYWGRLNRPHLKLIDGKRAPSANDEYLLYQTLLAVWPGHEGDGCDLVSLRARLRDYMEKACREAKTHSSWAEPNPHYEEALFSFIDALLADGTNPFLVDFATFHRLIARLGLYNSLSQCLLKLTAPGIPDIYQGCELWNFRLVDPDNRQPVDYVVRKAMLAELKERFSQTGSRELTAELLATLEDGRLKLFITWQLLSFRMLHEDLFSQSSYIPLSSMGTKAENICGFARRCGKKTVVSVCARFFASLTGQGQEIPCGAVWADTYLEAPTDPTGRWRDILTGNLVHMQIIADKEVFVIEEIFSILPVALLEFTEKD